MPRLDIPINLSVRVSSNVDFTANLASANALTCGLLLTSISWNALSVLAKAYVFLPVVGLILVGGTLPASIRTSANLSLLISVSFVTPASLTSLFL